MRNFLFVFFLLALVSPALASPSTIISGWQPGEIFFVGPSEEINFMIALYHSTDYGENIEIVDPHGAGFLMSDSMPNTIHRLYVFSYYQYQMLSEDGGISWVINNDFDANKVETYSAGRLAGEIYKSLSGPDDYYLARSVDFGYTYSPCAMNGFPSTNSIELSALGSSPGEIYISYAESLYYSNDYGENFDYLCNIYDLCSISTDGKMFASGMVPGELFLGYNNGTRIYRIYNYGQNAEQLIYESNNGYGSFTSTNQPGELYAIRTYLWSCGGDSCSEILIYHTTDYFQTWDLFQHIIYHTAVQDRPIQLPHEISLTVYPNPANATVNIKYNLNQAQDVEIRIYNVTGERLWQYHTGLQQPGEKRISYDAKDLTSGVYYLHLQTQSLDVTEKVIIAK